MWNLSIFRSGPDPNDLNDLTQYVIITHERGIFELIVYLHKYSNMFMVTCMLSSCMLLYKNIVMISGIHHAPNRAGADTRAKDSGEVFRGGSRGILEWLL